MERRTFLKISTGAAGVIMVPVFGNAIAAEELLNPVALSFKKALADAGLNAATKAGASYCDVRVGRYLNQFITTRDSRVENILNTESSIYTRRSRVGGNPSPFVELQGGKRMPFPYAGTTAVA